MEGVARNVLGHPADSGYPSDHATILFALCFGFRMRPPPTWPWLWVPALLLALSVAWARVLLGVHFPVNILGAAFLAVVSAALMVLPIGVAVTDRLASVAEASSA